MIIYRGLPGSGKTMLAASLIRQHPGRFVRINRDDLRMMAVGPGNNPYTEHSKAREALIRKQKETLIRQAFREGYDVILDDTHLIGRTVKMLHLLAQSIGDVEVVEVPVNTDIQDCIARDAGRAGYAVVGEKVIRDMANINKGKPLEEKHAYYPARPRTLPVDVTDGAKHGPQLGLPHAIICDLDGTLAHVTNRSPYDATNCHKDLPNAPVEAVVKAMFAMRFHIIFVSGREDKYREPTRMFLNRHCNIPHTLLMRATGDERNDSIVKREIYDEQIATKYNVLFALDDRDRVVDMWREMGIPCMQVNYGAF